MLGCCCGVPKIGGIIRDEFKQGIKGGKVPFQSIPKRCRQIDRRTGTDRRQTTTSDLQPEENQDHRWYKIRLINVRKKHK